MVCNAEGMQIIFHALSAEYKNKTIDSNANKARLSAVKLFFTVESLKETTKKITEYGGRVLDERWEGPGCIACNAVDPDGNLFQLRANLP